MLSPIVFNQLHRCLCLHANNVCYSLRSFIIIIMIPRGDNNVVSYCIQSTPSLSLSPCQLCLLFI